MVVYKPKNRKSGVVLTNFLVYEENEQIEGYVMFFPDGHVASLAVDVDKRRRGIGSILMNTLMRACRGFCWVEVRISNEGARAFYESLGLLVVDIESNYYGDEDAYIMALEQSPDT